ncbi:unnamed protein product [Phaeothamnion confervicola]
MLLLMLLLAATLAPSLGDAGSCEGRKVALVTGGSRGIGKGISEALAEAGMDIVLGFNSDREAAEATATDLSTKYGTRCVCVGGDCSLPETRDKYFKAVDEEFGGQLNALVHNAGQYVGITSDNVDTLEDRLLKFGDSSLLLTDGSVDLSTMRYYLKMYGEAWADLAERSLARMPDGDGHIVGISSPGCNAVVQPKPAYGMPGAGKSLMEYSMRLFAIAAGPRGINVNVVVPGVTFSDAWRRLSVKHGGPDDFSIAEGFAAKMPMQRAASPREIGDVVRFLCSKGGAYITGVSLPVDGGLHLGRVEQQQPRK